MKNIFKKIVLTLTLLLSFNTITTLAATNDENLMNYENTIEGEKFIENMISPRYSSTTEDWRLVSSSEKLISDKYSHTVEKTSTIAFNAGFTFKGVTVGSSNTYSKSRKFKVYNRTRDITMKFKVYTRMGHFLRYETVNRRITTKHHVAI